MDNDYAYWKALGNRYWPTFYVVNTQGQVELAKVGEMHKGTGNAKKMEDLIKNLLQAKLK